MMGTMSDYFAQMSIQAQSSPQNTTARATQDQVYELRSLRDQQASEAARASQAEADRRVREEAVEAARRAREEEADKTASRRYWSMFWLTVASVFFAAVAAVAAVVVLAQ